MKEKIISLLDYTSLNETDNEESIKKFCQNASTPLGEVAAVCVYPKFVRQANSLLRDSKILLATVVNFPAGDQSIETVKQQIDTALKDGADEIDLVIAYRDYIQSGKSLQSISLVAEAKKICVGKISAGQIYSGKLLKVILETGELGQDLIFRDLIFRASKDAIGAGAHFLKTSTGKTKTGATKEAVEIMLKVIQQHYKETKKRVGLKISGGVRELFQAEEYISLAKNICGEDFIQPSSLRIGASSLLDTLL